MPDDVFEIDDARAARLVSQARFAAYLVPFMQGPCTQRQASVTLNLKLNLLHYWVRKFERLGLLREIEVRSRAGRGIKVYEAVARTFVIPAKLLPAEHYGKSESAWLREFHQALERAAPELMDAGGVRVWVGDDGRLNINRTTAQSLPFNPLADDSPAVLLTWSGLALTRPQAKALQRDLWQVFERYRNQQARPDAQSYLLSLGLAPVDRS